MNGLHVVDFRGRTSLRNFVTIENASVRFNFMKMAELLHADYLMSMGYGFPPVMRIDARDRSVFSVDVTVTEPPPAPESLS